MTNIILPAALTAAAVLLLILISIEDIKTMEIPYRYNISLIITAALAVLYDMHCGCILAGSLSSHIIGAFCVSGPMFLAGLAVKDSFGGGDVLLTAGAGLYLGWQSMLWAVAAAAVFGGIFGAVMLITGRLGPKDHFPFGPFLSAGIGSMMIYLLLSLCFHSNHDTIFCC